MPQEELPPMAYVPGDTAKHRALKGVIGLGLGSLGAGLGWQALVGMRDMSNRFLAPKFSAKPRSVIVRVPYVDPDDRNGDGIPDRLQKSAEPQFAAGYTGAGDAIGRLATRAGDAIGMYRTSNPGGSNFAQDVFTTQTTNPLLMPWYPAAVLGAGWGGFSLGKWLSRQSIGAARGMELEAERDRAEREFQEATKLSADRTSPDGIDRLYAVLQKSADFNPIISGVLGAAGVPAVMFGVRSFQNAFKNVSGSDPSKLIDEAMKERQARIEEQSPAPIVLLPEPMEKEAPAQSWSLPSLPDVGIGDLYRRYIAGEPEPRPRRPRGQAKLAELIKAALRPPSSTSTASNSGSSPSPSLGGNPITSGAGGASGGIAGGASSALGGLSSRSMAAPRVASPAPAPRLQPTRQGAAMSPRQPAPATSAPWWSSQALPAQGQPWTPPEGYSPAQSAGRRSFWSPTPGRPRGFYIAGSSGSNLRPDSPDPRMRELYASSVAQQRATPSTAPRDVWARTRNYSENEMAPYQRAGQRFAVTPQTPFVPYRGYADPAAQPAAPPAQSQWF